MRDFYYSIDHDKLLDRLDPYVPDRRFRTLVYQYLKRCAERGGLFWEYDKGIPLGCPPSPVLGGFFLRGLDERLERLGLFYVRFMDDVLVLSPTRWKLRRAVRELHRVLADLGLEKQPAKTFIGRTDKGFEFLRYHLHADRLSVAQKTQERFAERMHRLYEQGRGHPLSPPGEIRAALARMGHGRLLAAGLPHP